MVSQELLEAFERERASRACIYASADAVIAEQQSEIERLTRELHTREQEVLCVRNSQTLELVNTKEKLAECRRLLREAVAWLDVTPMNDAMVEKWKRAAKAAGGDDE